MANYEKPGPPEGEAYGAAAVTQALDDVDFPISKDELIQKAGDRDIQWEEDKTVKLRSIVEKSDKDRFESMPDLVESVGRIA